MHKKFRVYFDKIDSFSAAEYTPEAIDIILNKAQDIVLEELINTGLEKTQTFSDYLSSIIVKRTINTFSTDSESEVNGKYINIPSDYRKFLMDRVVLKVPDCVFSTYIENGVDKEKIRTILNNNEIKCISDILNLQTEINIECSNFVRNWLKIVTECTKIEICPHLGSLGFHETFSAKPSQLRAGSGPAPALPRHIAPASSRHPAAPS